MPENTGGLRYAGLLTLLIACAMLLTARLCYLYIAQPERFPIHSVNIAATWEHISHEELEAVLTPYLQSSFFSLPVTRLQNVLNALPWVNHATVERVWPDTVKITLEEKKPIAIWGTSLLTEDGQLFEQNPGHQPYDLPVLKGPEAQHGEVLQVFQKLGKILSIYGLSASTLHLRDNQAWILTLSNGIHIHLGKQALESRLLRFCKAWPAVFAERQDKLLSVDMRYRRGMAVQWKQQTEK